MKFTNIHTSKLDVLYTKRATEYFSNLSKEYDLRIKQAQDVGYVKRKISEEIYERMRGLHSPLSKLHNQIDNHYKKLLLEEMDRSLKEKNENPVFHFVKNKMQSLRTSCKDLYKINPGTHSWDADFLNASNKKIIDLIARYFALKEFERILQLKQSADLEGGARKNEKKKRETTIARYKQFSEAYIELTVKKKLTTPIAEKKICKKFNITPRTLYRAITGKP